MCSSRNHFKRGMCCNFKSHIVCDKIVSKEYYYSLANIKYSIEHFLVVGIEITKTQNLGCLTVRFTDHSNKSRSHTNKVHSHHFTWNNKPTVFWDSDRCFLSALCLSFYLQLGCTFSPKHYLLLLLLLLYGTFIIWLFTMYSTEGLTTTCATALT